MRIESIPACSSAFFLVAALILSGCGSDIGSCSIVTGATTTCIDYTNAGITAVNAKNLCINTGFNSTRGTYTASTMCTITGRIGRCVVFAGTESEQTFHYLGGWTTGDSQADCSARSGTYTSG